MCNCGNPQNNYLYQDEPWEGMPAATDFLVQITYRTTLRAPQGQLVFRCGMVLNTPLIAYWGYSMRCYQKQIGKTNQLENKNHKLHIYRIRDKLLVGNKKSKRY